MTPKRTARQIAVLLPFLFISLIADAFMVTIEPDDYAPGTDLSRVSPYVTLQGVAPWAENGPVSARTIWWEGVNAPTGDLTFGNFSFDKVCCIGGPYEADIDAYVGFGMFFNQEVNHVSLLGVTTVTPYLYARWAAFDQTGSLIATGSPGPNYGGDTFLMDIRLEGIWTLIVGGDLGTASMWFDHLVFEVNSPNEVPEPGPLALLAIGIAGLLIVRRSQR